MWGVIGGSRRSRASGGAAAGDWAEGGLVGCWWAAGGLLHWPTAGGHSAGAGQEAGSPWPMRCWLQLQLCGPGVKASSSAYVCPGLSARSQRLYKTVAPRCKRERRQSNNFSTVTVTLARCNVCLINRSALPALCPPKTLRPIPLQHSHPHPP